VCRYNRVKIKHTYVVPGRKERWRAPRTHRLNWSGTVPTPRR